MPGFVIYNNMPLSLCVFQLNMSFFNVLFFYHYFCLFYCVGKTTVPKKYFVFHWEKNSIWNERVNK